MSGDGFDWASGECVVIGKQAAIAVYENLAGAVVIREQGDYPEEDYCFVIQPANLRPLIAALISITKQIEAARVALSRHTKRRGKFWIRIFPDLPITKKPLETRMGKGKGPLESWVAVIRPGNMLFEMVGVPEAMAKEALRLAASKLPIPCKFVKR